MKKEKEPLTFAEKFRVAATPNHYRILALLATCEDAVTVKEIQTAYPDLSIESIHQYLYRLCQAGILETDRSPDWGGASVYYVGSDDFAQKLFDSGLLVVPEDEKGRVA